MILINEQSRWIYLRGAGFALGNGVDQVLFDLHGGYYDDPALMAAVADINAMSRRATNHDKTSVAEVLVVADEVSTFYTTMSSALLKQNLYDPPYQLIKMGAPYDSIYVNDLALADMISQLDHPANNVHFRDEWQEGKMTFDYQMHEGVVPKSNALSLMRLLGLEV